MALENRVFSRTESAKISDRYTAVRLLGGVDSTPEVEEFMRRYEVEGYPTLLAMTADGAVLARDLPRDVDGILDSMSAAGKAEAEFQAKKTELSAKTDAPSLIELAKLHVGRSELEPARALYAKVVEKDPSAANFGELAEVQARLGDAPGERRTLESMVQKFAADPDRIRWRVRLATMDLPTSASTEEEFLAVVHKHEEALTALLKTVEAEGSVPDQAELHFRLGDFAGKKQDVEGMKTHFAWIAEHDAKGKRAAPARLQMAVVLFQSDDLEGAVALLEKIVAENAGTEEAAQAAQALPELKQEIANRKKAAEEGAKDAPEDDGDDEGGEDD